MKGTREARWRLILTPPASGASNMALDHALLASAAREGFMPTLRFYRWSPPALSIGRFQPVREVDLTACEEEGIGVVRRPTGGKSILHMDDFTYSIVLPGSWELPRSVVAAYLVICSGIIAALREVGVEAYVQSRNGEDYRVSGGACFAATTRADLVWEGRKLCGSAQVRRSGAILQHGSLFLSDRAETQFRVLSFPSREERATALHDYRRRCATLEEAGCRASWEELGCAFLRGFQEAFEVEIAEGELTQWERGLWRRLEDAYRSREWLLNADSRPLPAPVPADA